MVAQVEHQFHLGRLSIQGLWFYCQVWTCLKSMQLLLGASTHLVFDCLEQPMMGSMLALSTVIHKASANNFMGSAVLNLLQSQAKTFFFILFDTNSHIYLSIYLYIYIYLFIYIYCFVGIEKCLQMLEFFFF